jgi:hypothetical protein
VKRIDELGDGDLGREVHQEVDVVVLAVELHQLTFEVHAHRPHDLLHTRQMNIGKHPVRNSADQF